VRRIPEEYHKHANNAVLWIWLRSRYEIPEFLTIAPVLTSTLTVCAALRRLYIGERERERERENFVRNCTAGIPEGL